MKILLQHVTLLSPGSKFHGKTKDVFIDGDTISKISDAGTIIEKADKTIDCKNFSLSPGWFDLHVNFCEPGFEYKEDLDSGCAAAAQGGFTGVLCMPGTFPPIHSKSVVEFIRTKTKNNLVEVYPAGALSHNMEGKDLSEMFDMSQAGALAFTDDKHAVQDSSLMMRALLYVKNFGGKIFSFADDHELSSHGQMNEGVMSTSLGLKGMPALAEEVMVSRDLELAVYTDSSIHISTVSTKRTVELIREYKKKGLKVTADVSAANLFLDDSKLEDFDSVYKVKPALRTKEDITALIDGLKDGTIDAICSDHNPQDIENKRKEFSLAEFGMSGLETAFAAANSAIQGKLNTEILVEKFSSGPRKILGLPEIRIEEGQPANLTLFNPKVEWTVGEKDLKSKSKNNPFIGVRLVGKPVAVMNKGQVILCV